MHALQTISYPRPDRHCHVHHISPSEDIELDQNGNISNLTLARALAYLRQYLSSEYEELVKGDLIVFDDMAGYNNNGIVIFDGIEIIPLFKEIDREGSLPPEFRVIEDNVPISYWTDMDQLLVQQDGIKHNTIVWFNHGLVRDQCLDNLQYGMADRYQFYIVFTTFNYNNNPYRIIFDYEDCGFELTDMSQFINESDLNKVLRAIRETLTNDNLIVFCTHNENMEVLIDDNYTLFVRLAPPVQEVGIVRKFF